MSDNVPVFDQRTRPQGDHPSTPVEDGAVPREPEKLTIPPESVADLVMMSIRTAEGNAWWRGFVTAHGTPSWIAAGGWGLRAHGAVDIVKQAPQEARGPVGR